MEEIIIGTLNINQLGVQTTKEIPNANSLVYKNLDYVLAYIEDFFSNDSGKKLLFLNEMKYRNSYGYTGGYKKFKQVLTNKGYTILENDTSIASRTVTFKTLAITKNNLISKNDNPLFTHEANARYIELKYKDYIFLGIHQSINKDYPPLELLKFVEKCKNNFVIIGDFNVNRSHITNSSYDKHEKDLFKLINENMVIDVFGDNKIPTFDERRIDYILTSLNSMKRIISFSQDNSPRVGEGKFTDHSLLQISLSIN